MCVVSSMGDGFRDYWKPWPYPNLPDPFQPALPSAPIIHTPDVYRHEFEALKKEVELMKALLKRAKIYDEETGQPDCEMDEKVEILKRVAEIVGVDLSEVFGKPK